MNTAVENLLAEIKSMRWLDNHGSVNPDWVVFDNRGAAYDAAAYDVTCDATFDATCDAACDAALDAVYYAARDAARAAAHYATYEAARDAALLAVCLVAFADQPDNLHLAHARARWAVWQAGFGLIADVDGKLFVYRKI